MSLMIMAKNKDETVLASGDLKSGVVFELEGNWYFDPQAVDMTQLVVTERTYVCPYKGTCYWIDLQTPDLQARNVGWVYREPKTGYENIKNRIAFYARETSGTKVVSEPNVIA